MNSRRKFIRQTTCGAIGLMGWGLLPPQAAWAKRDKIKITILHTNDVHSYIDPMPSNHPKYPGLGGAARRAALINAIRSEEKNVLLLDAGDIIQGTPYFNLFNGEVEIKLMNEMGYDACTIGNHDFDNGLEHLAGMIQKSNFPFLIANYDFSDTPLFDKVSSYKIFEKEGIRIGVFGLGIELEGLVAKRLYGNTLYLDPLENAARMAFFLKKNLKCDLVICLSHLGFKYKENKVSDTDLAQRSKHIDLIIGGHTHTMLDQPLAYRNSDGLEVLVSQVGWAGVRLGRIDYYFERRDGKTKINQKESANISVGPNYSSS